MEARALMVVPGFILVALLGYWVASSAVPGAKTAGVSGVGAKVVSSRERAPVGDGARVRGIRHKVVYEEDHEAVEAGALPGQRVIVFKNKAAMEEFLRLAGAGVQVMGRLDALNALRIGFLNAADLADLLSGGEELAFVFPVELPTEGQGVAQAGAVPMGDGLLGWLGIEGDNSQWGSGVKIAILDTGVVAHDAFGSKISWFDLVGLADPSRQNGHGTAVASVIIGNAAATPGIAPAAEILSFRIANDLGQSDSFLLATGITSAVDSGAQIINISMGSFGDSAIVRNAIEYARSAGVLIVAAAGNNGENRIAFPAANRGVIAVGAVDAAGAHLDFSNTGSQLAVSAPGFEIQAAWPGNTVVSASGTSFSAPIIAGSIAAIMTQTGKGTTAQQAADLLFSYLNDGGAAGFDPAYGAGMPDIGRVLQAGTAGIHDAAVAGQRVIMPSAGAPYGQVEVLIQNRGTASISNARVNVSTSWGNVAASINYLAPNAVQTVLVPLGQQAAAATSLRFESRVSLSGVRDVKPSNDRRVDQYAPPR